jgi:REP element-mobilizing transposase RayT
MTRERLIVPGGLFHVTTNAVGTEALFSDRVDCTDYLERLPLAARRFEWDVAGYCLMGTHVHLLVSPRNGALGPGMQWLKSGYARWFNRRHHRRGALHCAPYDVVLVETEEHLLEVVRYIALNPVRARLCAHPEDWLWSSYPALVGAAKPLPFLNFDPILELFVSPRRTTIERIREFVAGELDRPLLAA